MLTEQVCLEVLRTVGGQNTRWTTRVGENVTTSSVTRHSIGTAALYRALMGRYSLSDIDTAMKWLEYGEFIGFSGMAFAPRMATQLTEKGERAAKANVLEPTDRESLYQENPYAVFVARQFADADLELFGGLERLLNGCNLDVYDGRVDGIEAFRGEIIRKIKDARYFVCLLSRRSQLSSGKFASSVWLYQETGAAVALGKKPLILVEDGMDEHYAGELQKNYEYTTFTRQSFATAADEVRRRIESDLTSSQIPLPTKARGAG